MTRRSISRTRATKIRTNDLVPSEFQKFNACEEYVLDFFVFEGIKYDFALSSHCDDSRRFQILQLV